MNLVRLKNAQAQNGSRCSRADVKFGAYKIALLIEDVRFYDTVPTRQVFTLTSKAIFSFKLKKAKYFSSFKLSKMCEELRSYLMGCLSLI